ncbi:TIR domain-containing protein [Streptomyces sp. NPDC008313]|uniref:TIR domain-containing protein n=1 Tax=Streptomyces sp. NPDC008313 TaxID=3364826 RepID=UPI0036E8BFD6
MDQTVKYAYFYTSCTRSDGWPAISRFHADLEYRLRVQEGLWVSGVLGPQLGSGPVLESGIAGVGAMIALFSPAYFTDRDCGLEWAVFQRRRRLHKARTGQDAPECLIPLLWEPVPPGDFPPDTPPLTDWPTGPEWDGSYGREQYAARGLAGLMREDTAEANEAYFSLIGQLAQRIADLRRVGFTSVEDADELRDLEPEFGIRSQPRGITLTGGTGSTGIAAHRTVSTGPVVRPVGLSLPAPRSAPLSVAISYVGADQPWADWMEEVLGQDGLAEVRQVRWQTERESLTDTVGRAHEAGDRVVVIFSRSYFAAGSTEPLDWQEAFVGPDKGWLIALQIDAEPRPLLVRRGVPVKQLDGSDESRAELLRRLVREVGLVLPDPRERDRR